MNTCTLVLSLFLYMIRDAFCFSFLYRGLASDEQWFSGDDRSDLDLMTFKAIVQNTNSDMLTGGLNCETITCV